jgi:AcrR family transcriptional regulator
MPPELDMPTEEPGRPYHHGRLREALVEAGVGLARTGGPEAVVLRSATRAAGVSHNAAYRHFDDRDELLRAVCERCMGQLAQLMESRIDAVPAENDPVAEAWLRLGALGSAYVEFATSEPGWFRTAFAVPRTTHVFGPGEGVGNCGLGPYEMLGAGLDELVRVGAIPAERRPGAEYVAWSAVHGLSSLLIDGPLRELPDAERAHALDTVLEAVVRGL